MKPGIKTSEFALAAAIFVASTVLLATGRITPTQWSALSTGSGGIYAILRTVLKLNLPVQSSSITTVSGQDTP